MMDLKSFPGVSLWTFILSLVKGSFVVNVTQSSYQAEENHNITLEWTFTTKSDAFISSLKVRCRLRADQKYSVLYYVFDGVEFSDVQDEKFSGRVQSDKDALREGRIRLQLSRLSTEDSGLYLCEVTTGDGSGYNSCRVTVSDPNFPKTSTTQTLLHPRNLQTPDHQDEIPGNGRCRVSVVIVVVAFISVVVVTYFSHRLRLKLNKRPEDETQKQPLPV
ncbi:uncharacterized protein LOC115796695 isoform X6 [Archocentrus centrarchus]|uniref:uncharacterized protein LOC115796695 isoform X6 n=1 Tax=Archocentrus centrarchus TaxID=63155 RepID=UPI0011E9CA12|nr:uncharacterized protein LOC115796695 isoform X6 [Archocentrus centrarchus]